MKSTLKNMIVVLFIITLISSSAVGGVFLLTNETIQQAEKSKLSNSLKAVLPPFTSVDEPITVKGTGDQSLLITPAKKDGKIIGYAVETYSTNGYSGLIKLLVGFTADGSIYKIEVVSQQETPGLGAKIAEKGSPFVVQFEGKNPETFKLSVKKDGGDVDAITASTISSRAYSEAVQRAYDAVKSLKR